MTATYTGGVLDETRHAYFSASWQVLEERLGTTPGTADAERQFVWGLRALDDLVLRDRDTTGNGTLDERLYALADANGNVIAVVDDTGAVQERYEYDAYGVPAFLDATFGSRASSSYAWETLYAGYRWDATPGLYHVRFRVYLPQYGVWMQRDPLVHAAGLNLYRYGSNAPVNRVDPLGLADEFPRPFPPIRRGGPGKHCAACHPVQHRTPVNPYKFGNWRKLTPEERQFFEYIYLAAMPGLRTEEYRVALARTLRQTTLWDASTVDGLHAIHPWNVITQTALLRDDVAAVTLGSNQYYRSGKWFMPPNTPARLDLIGHELFHGLHADTIGAGATGFIIPWGVDCLSAGVFEEGEFYRKNLSEIWGHAMQHTIQDFEQLFQYFKKNRMAHIPPGTQDTIRIRFMGYLNQELMR